MDLVYYDGLGLVVEGNVDLQGYFAWYCLSLHFYALPDLEVQVIRFCHNLYGLFGKLMVYLQLDFELFLWFALIQKPEGFAKFHTPFFIDYGDSEVFWFGNNFVRQILLTYLAYVIKFIRIYIFSTYEAV